MKKKGAIILKSFLVSSYLILLSCGGGGGGSSDSTPETSYLQGYFIDEPVAGLTVENVISGSISTTDTSGLFSIQGKVGDELCFKVGNLSLGCIKPNQSFMVITPSILNPSKAREIVSLLRSVDEDNNPSNGITIPQDIQFNVPSINDVNIGDVIESTLGEFTLTEPDMTAPQKNDIIAKGFNILKQFEGKNLVESPTQVNQVAILREFSYSNISFDPTRAEVKLSTSANGTIDGYLQIYGYNCHVKGNFNCTGSSGRIYYDEATSTVKGETSFTCNTSVNYDCGVDSGTETDTANCLGTLTMDPADIDWANRKVVGTFKIQCNFANYPEFNYSYTSTITLQGN